MTTSPRIDRPRTIRLPGRLALGEAVSRLVSVLGGALPQGPLRVEVDVADCRDVLAWLEAQRAVRRVAFVGRDNDVAFAGVGCALELPALSSTDRAVERLPDCARLVFAQRFDATRAPSLPWAKFGVGVCFVPRITLEESGAGTTLAVHLFPQLGSLEPVRDVARHELAALRSVLAPEQPLPAPKDVRARPDRDGFNRAVEACLEAFRTTSLGKVVLAREQTLVFEQPVDSIAVARALRRTCARSTIFAVEVSPGVAFVGATPERLYRRRGRVLETEALAGTATRVGNDVDDAVAAQALFDSDKDQREHAFVRAHVVDALAGLSTQVEAERVPTPHMLTRLIHLRTHIHATLRDDVDDAAIVDALHPTPAVCGTPTTLARQAVQRLEPFDRGLYAGALGWVTREDADVVVGIRSALVLGREVSLFAGAGIVASSNAAFEWREIEAKLETVGQLFTTARAAEPAR